MERRNNGENPGGLVPGDASLIYQCEMRRPHVLSQRLAPLDNAPCLLFLSFLFCFPLSAQDHKPASAPAPAQLEVPTDSLGPATPRGAVLGFLGTARKGGDELAAQYLNAIACYECPRKGLNERH